MSETIRGDRELGVLADNRSRSTIRDWRRLGLPHQVCPDDNKTIIYDLDQAVSWCADRAIDFYSKDNEPTPLQQEKYRQEKYKADEAEHKARIRDMEYAPVRQFEETQIVLLQQVRILMVSIVEDIKKKAKLKGSEAEAIDAELIAGFNKIADIDLSE